MQPINIYIHIPFCFSKCPYCGFFSCTNCNDSYREYFKTLNQEIIEKSKKYKDREIQTIYIGGGTPNLVPYEYIVRAIDNIKKNFNLYPNVEISIELHPQYITEESVLGYKGAGINRMSIGLQTTHNEDLKQLNRRYTYEQFLIKYFILKKNNINNIGIDLIFGYPQHTFKKWTKTLKLITDLDIQHISCYSLEIEEGTPYDTLYKQNRLPIPEENENRDMYHYTCEYLSKRGFHQYEISNWSKDSLECKHNLNFWSYKDYIGFGAGAYSRVNGIKSSNPKNIQKYIHGEWDIDVDKLSPKQKAIERIVLGLRLNNGIEYERKIFLKKYMTISPENKMRLNDMGKDFYNEVVRNILLDE